LQFIAYHAYGVSFCAQAVFLLDVIFPDAEDDTDGGLITGAAFLVVKKVQVKIHLARIFGFERPDLQLEGDQGFEEAVIEKQIDEVRLFPQGQTVRAADTDRNICWSGSHSRSGACPPSSHGQDDVLVFVGLELVAQTIGGFPLLNAQIVEIGSVQGMDHPIRSFPSPERALDVNFPKSAPQAGPHRLG